jgi:hypothetical protein
VEAPYENGSLGHCPPPDAVRRCPCPLDLHRGETLRQTSRPPVSIWPKGLAEAIADRNYLDGFSYQNPGYVIESVDTFFYNGDTEGLNSFLAKLARVKGLRTSVSFSNAEGRTSKFVRAGIVRNGEALGLPLSKLDGRPCSWLASVSPKGWFHQPPGGKAEAEARVLIFLGGKKVKLEGVRLPAWGD